MRTTMRNLAAASVLALTALHAVPALAQEEEAPSDITVTGNAAIVTDYRFRGVSLSGGDPAIQGGFDIGSTTGFYVGTWGSSIDGGDLYGHTEIDIYGGFAGEVTPGLAVNVGLLYYLYPGNDSDFGDADYFEPFASLSTTMGPVSAKVGVAYAWEQESLGDSDNLYLYTDLSAGIPTTPLSINGHLGYTDGVLAPTFVYGDGTDRTAMDWSVGVAYTVGKMSLGLSYVGVDGPEVDEITDDAVVGKISVVF